MDRASNLSVAVIGAAEPWMVDKVLMSGVWVRSQFRR